jgi:gamma-glutamyltranspeptidase/glutathione hydrolase
VAASQPLAVAAGLEILSKGGNAADAAVAAAAALNVTEPGSTGLGGDCFALYYHGISRDISALNGSGRAPARLTLELLRSAGLAEQ